MLPHPDSLPLPFKEGIRDIRCSIRVEAQSGALSSRLLGTPRPSRRLARLADDLLSQAEKVVDRMLAQSDAGLEARLDRLMAGLMTGRLAERSGDAYALCRAILEEDEPSGLLVSELKLAIRPTDRTDVIADPVLAAVEQARRMASQGILRRCLSTTLLLGESDAGAERDARVALAFWLSVLVRAESREEASLVLKSVRLVLEAEGDVWIGLLRERRLGELAELWRRTLPYLP